jgi:hypothetical protein
MIAEPKQVTEYHITCEALPKQKFVVRADSPEKAVRKLIAELRSAIAELHKQKGQEKPKTSIEA